MNGFEMILPFLKPIEHLILDHTISEVMVNGPDHIFIERDGFVEEVRGLSIGEKSLMIAVKNIARRLGDDICEAKPILDSRLPDGSRRSHNASSGERACTTSCLTYLPYLNLPKTRTAAQPCTHAVQCTPRGRRQSSSDPPEESNLGRVE